MGLRSLYTQVCVVGHAGALGGYMWKNREVNQSTDKLLSIAGIAAISLAMGWSNETKVDNLGECSRPPGLACGFGRGWAWRVFTY